MDQTPQDSEEFTGEIFEPEIPSQASSFSIREQEQLFNRNENKAFHIVKIVLISIFGLYVIILSGILLFHLLAPSNWRWLPQQEIASLEKMFVTGIGAALLGKFGNKIADFK